MTELSVSEGEADYRAFTAYLQALRQQPEYATEFGAFWWAIVRIARRLLYELMKRQTGLRLWTARAEEDLVAGLMIGNREIGLPIVTTDPIRQRAALRLIHRRLVAASREPRHRYVRTKVTNVSIIRALEASGLVAIENSEWAVRLDLGALTFSFVTRRPGRWRRQFGAAVVPLIRFDLNPPAASPSTT